jgi:colanic acid biosynthesis glycosyl transferase WcaI
MQILVVNQYFHPDRSATSQLLTELCEDLSEHHDVTVVAGRPSYDPSETRELHGFLAEDRHGSIRVLRSWSTTFPRTNMAGRLTNYATYLMSCMAGAIRATRPDVVLTMTDPPVVAVAAAVASTVHKVPFVYVNQDVFPEVGVALGRIRQPTLVRSLTALNRSLRRRAASVVAIGRDMERRLVALGCDPAKIEVIPNWTDGSLVRPLEGPSRLRGRCGWDDRFVVMHSGNVGLSQDLDTLIAAADLLSAEPDVVFAIVGEGASKAAVMADVARRGLGNVEFLPYQPKDDLSDSLGAADLHVVGLKRGLAGYIVPSKVYGILAAGKPYVAAVEPGTEPALIAEEHACGVRVEPGDPGALAAAIREMQGAPLDEMGTNARKALEERFERRIATESYRRLLEALAEGGRSRLRSP